MASTAAMASTSSTTLTQESRPQAGPRPLKRGEIGFMEGVHEQVQVQSQMTPSSDPLSLPARHPADRRPPTPSLDPINEAPEYSGTSETASDTASIVSKRSFLGHRRLPKFMGIHFTTLILLFSQACVFVGTIIGWVFASMAISGGKTKAPTPEPGPNNDQNISTADTGSSNIFIHVAFAIVVLAQIVLFERRIYRTRAERYVFKHPGEMLPISLRRGSGANPSMSIAPWSRPPLPTYAAALAASGVGTGDVEDAEIAQPPPPAYGKTRGSTLVLAGYLRDSLRVQAREHEEGGRRASGGGASLRGDDRPISFVSRDEEWEVRRDADRARRIEEALAALEDAQPVLRATAEPISGQQQQERDASRGRWV